VAASGNKIAIFLPSLEGGGAERVFVQLANRFAARGISVSLVLVALRGPYLDEVHPQVNVVDLGAKGTLRALFALRRYLRAERPDVLLSALEHANIVAILAARLSFTKVRNAVAVRSVPSVVYANSSPSLRRWLTLQLTRRLYPLADAVIANSNAVRADLAGPLGVPESRLSVIYNPIDVEQILRLADESIEHPWLRANREALVIAVGSLTPLKDFPTLLRAFAHVRRHTAARLVILGEGPCRGPLESLATKLEIESDLLLAGFVSNPYPWIQGAGVFVSASLTEGCPNALMQALACDTKVVSTDCVGGSGEILEGGKWGDLVPVGDADAMAEAIARQLKSAEPVDTQRRARDFSLERIVGEYLDVLFGGAAKLNSAAA